MSHAVNIKTQIKNIENLLDQFRKFGWEIQNHEKCRSYPGDPRRNETHQYVAKNPKPTGYDVGINLDEEGNAFFVCDFFDSSIASQLGANLKDIKQGYALDELKKFMVEENLSYDIHSLPSGELVVTATN